VVIGFLLLGCGTPIKYANYRDIKCPIYAATSGDCQFVYAVVTNKNSGQTLSARDFGIFTPLAIIDFPIAIVVDTVALPYDSYVYHKNNTAYEFWVEAFVTGTINANDPVEDYFKHGLFIKDMIRNNLNSNKKMANNANATRNNLIDCLITLAIKDDPCLVNDLTACKYLSEPQIERLYTWEAAQLKNVHGSGGFVRLAQLLALPNRTTSFAYRISQSDNEYELAPLLEINDISHLAKTNIISRLMSTSSWQIQCTIAQNKFTTPEQLTALASSENKYVLDYVAKNAATPIAVLDTLARQKPYTRPSICMNPATSARTIQFLYDSNTCSALEIIHIAQHANTPIAILEELSRKNDRILNEYLSKNPHLHQAFPRDK